MVAAVTFLAQNSQEVGDEGLGTGMVVLGVVIAILVFATIITLFVKSTKRSKGGVEAAPGEQRRGTPPLESLHRDA